MRIAAVAATHFSWARSVHHYTRRAYSNLVRPDLRRESSSWNKTCLTRFLMRGGDEILMSEGVKMLCETWIGSAVLSLDLQLLFE